MVSSQEQFTRYEIARILGARALQLAMDAPPLLKLSEDDLKELRYDSIKIAEKELDEEALPISIHRPTPEKAKSKLKGVKEDTTSDEALEQREKEEEKEIAESVEEMGLVNEADQEETESSTGSEE
jgi:DNA-directed RNA polymerase subunit K/omega